MIDKLKHNFPLYKLVTDKEQRSVFVEHIVEGADRGGMLLSGQIQAVNLRLRCSASDYKSDWHVAGDPTLIIIQQGTLRIILQDNSFQDFSAGEYFVAQDNLPDDTFFDATRHGHRAEVLGDEALQAVHIKLATAL